MNSQNSQIFNSARRNGPDPSRYAEASQRDLESTMIALRDQAQEAERHGGDVESIYASFKAVEAELESRKPQGRQSQHCTLPGDRNNTVTATANARAGVLLPMNCASPSALLFGDNRSDGWGRDPEPFFNAIAHRLHDPRLIQNATGVESVGADGGFSVPQVWFRGVVDQALSVAEFAPRCKLFPTDSNSLVVPMPDLTDRATDLAGLTGNWSAEGATQTAQRLRWRQVELKLGKVFILAEASSELAEDGVGFGDQLTAGMTAATAYTLDDAILKGTGVGQPLGILNSASAIEVAPESGQAADTLRFENLINMFARLAPSCQKKASWFVSPGLWPELLRMVFPGSSTPVLLGAGQNNSAAGAPIATIFGLPVVTTEISRPAGDRGDIVLADMGQYALAVRSAARIESDGAPGFARDVQSWRLVLRVTGQSLWNAPITPYAGGSTLSWATYLGAR